MRTPLAAGLLAMLLLAGCASPQAESLTRADVTSDEPVQPAAPEWAPLASASIRPGTPLQLADRTCNSNFVFSRNGGAQAFLGTTAACVQGLPIGTGAAVGGPRNIAILVYSSWITMEEKGEQDPAALEYNDFAVFYVDSSSRGKVNPALPVTGGPTGAGNASALETGARVRYWGAAPLATSAGWHDAFVTGRVGEWAVLAHGLLPATPGTMGGGVTTTQGEAVGVMVNLGLAPNPGANGIARLDKLMAYAAEHAKMDMELATWDYTG